MELSTQAAIGIGRLDEALRQTATIGLADRLRMAQALSANLSRETLATIYRAMFGQWRHNG